MDYLNIIRNNDDLRNDIDALCDVWIEDNLSELDRSLGYAKERFRVFGTDASGGVYGLIGDGDIALLPIGNVSSEGQSGRIADNMEDFFHLITFCPFWEDLCWKRGISKESFLQLEAELREYFDDDYEKMQSFIARELCLNKDTDVLKNLYSALTTQPPFIVYCTEDDNPSEHWLREL